MSWNSSNGSDQRALVRPGIGPKRSKSLGRRMAEQERELTDQMAEKRKRRRAARDVYGAVVLALPQNQPNAPLYPAGGAPGSRPGALPHFGRPRYLGPPPRARSTAG